MGIVTVKNVQKTFKNVEKTLGQRNPAFEAPAWRPPGGLSPAAFQCWPTKEKNVERTRKERRKNERKQRRKNGDKNVERTFVQRT